MKSFRQKQLYDILERDHMINTAAVAEHFGVSIETIRRDLNQLEKQGVLRKTYGGAELRAAPPIVPPQVELHRESYHDIKTALAARTAQYVPDGSTIALDAGSTVLEVCKFLKEKRDLVIICGDVFTAAELLGSRHRIYMMGGFLAPDGSSSGSFAKEFLNNITTIDVFISSADGANPDDGLSTNETGNNELKKRYIRKAKTRVVMVDHSKFTRNAFYKTCNYSDIDYLVTDSDTPAATVEKIRRLGTEVDLVSI